MNLKYISEELVSSQQVIYMQDMNIFTMKKPRFVIERARKGSDDWKVLQTRVMFGHGGNPRTFRTQEDAQDYIDSRKQGVFGSLYEFRVKEVQV